MKADLANVDKSPHKSLVAEGCDSVLGLFPRSILNNPEGVC